MSEIQGVGGVQGPREIDSKRPAERSQPAGPGKRSDRPDSVEISDRARFQAKLGEIPDIRTERVEAIRQALEHADGNRALAAKRLNISERTLYRRIEEYGLQ